MFDLHCHILPGIDDGAADMRESLALADIFARDGIAHVAATPHCHRQWRHLKADIVPRVAVLNEQIARRKIPLAVIPGSEIQAYDTAIYRRDFDDDLYCHLGGGRAFTLLEFPWNRHEYPNDAADLVAWIVARGTTPILAHPERHPHFVDDPGRLQALVDAGAWIQITADSLFGNHGRSAQSAAGELLRKYPRAVLSTDSHNLQRCSGLSKAFAWVNGNIGPGREAELRANAQRILDAVLVGGTSERSAN